MEWLTAVGLKVGTALFVMVLGPMVTAALRKTILRIDPAYAPLVSVVTGAIVAGLTGDADLGAETAVDGAVAQKMVDHVPTHARTAGDEEHERLGGNSF